MTAIIFTPDALQVSFHDSDQARSIATRPVIMESTLMVERGNRAFADEIEDLQQKADALLEDVLEEHRDAEVYVFGEEEDEDEPTGMGEG